MFNSLNKIFNQNDRDIKHLEKTADKVDKLSDKMAEMSDENLKAKTDEFKRRYEKGESLDSMKVEAFAVCREAAKRVLGMFPHKVQVIGALAVHEGNISEMKTGEGKTLTATMAVYLNAISGEGVHVVTVNEYLSSRDAKEMGELYEWLGLTVGVNSTKISKKEKRDAYLADITYSTNSELAFDYLRDNMTLSKDERVQRNLNFAVIDEVDSILIDEARAPIIISGQAKDMSALYKETNNLMYVLEPGDCTYDEESKIALLTSEGISKVEQGFGIENLYDPQHVSLNHAIAQSMRAHFSLQKDVDYVVQDGEVLIVDSFTGRILKGRRFSEGLHQALEAKEKVEIRSESRTLATLTFQNYFRMYKKLSGMTGTAKTEEEEFLNIYNMFVIQIPTNKPVKRDDREDVIYSTLKAKYQAIVSQAKEAFEKGQPVLVGTVSIEASEELSELFTANNIPHNVLNAKNHEGEAEIIAKAGVEGSVTIATNMAGRGTDIKPTERSLELGGLFVIGTERHESRRIDNQLRGRSGRQGNVGVTQFFLSLEDELMLKLGSERMQTMVKRLGLDESKPIKSKLISQSVELSQKQEEGRNFDMRKSLLQYEEVLHEQREVIYNKRNYFLELEDTKEAIDEMIDNVLDKAVSYYSEDLEELEAYVSRIFLPKGSISVDDLKGKSESQIKETIKQKVFEEYKEREEKMTSERMRGFERIVLLRSVDKNWTEHLEAMEQLKIGIHLRAYAQIDPILEYKNEGFAMFEGMLDSIEEYCSNYIMKAVI